MLEGNSRGASSSSSSSSPSSQSPPEPRADYTITFQGQKLGLTLQRVPNSQLAFVEKAPEGGPGIGDVIVAVGGDSVGRNRYETTVETIRTAPRPVTIAFRPSLGTTTAAAIAHQQQQEQPRRRQQYQAQHSGNASTVKAARGEASGRPRPSRRPPPPPLAPRPGARGRRGGPIGGGGGALPDATRGELDVRVLDSGTLDGLVLTRGGDGQMLVVRSAAAFKEKRPDE